MSIIEPHTLKIYTAKAQADKAINSLKSILLGIGLDKVITV